jgi:mono/diheme cytochrome c family protein
VSKKVRVGCLSVLTLIGIAAVGAQGQTAAPPAAAPAGGATMTPQALVDSTPKGKLKNPYKDDDAAAVQAGKDFYFHSGCNGCHGGNGGGGMCPPLTNDIWVYGGDDDTLFRLVTLGSVPTADALWKIITFVRSNYHGSPPCKFGCPVDAPPPPGS